MATKPQPPAYTVPLVESDGRVNKDWYKFLSTLGSAGEYQTTVGAAGGASALPATPLGYKDEFINGENVVIPFYNKS